MADTLAEQENKMRDTCISISSSDWRQEIITISLIPYPSLFAKSPCWDLLARVCSYLWNLFQALLETRYSRWSIQAHDESGPDTNRRLKTQGLQRETVRVVLHLDLLPSLSGARIQRQQLLQSFINKGGEGLAFLWERAIAPITRSPDTTSFQIRVLH